MDEMQFERQVRADPELRAFVDGMAREAGQELTLEEPGRKVTGVEVLFGLAAYALFRRVKDTLDDERTGKETDEIAWRAAIVAELVAKGIPPKDAQTTVLKVSEQVARRSKDDPILKKVLAWVGLG
jgi:anti-sigma-K factor RskA